MSDPPPLTVAEAQSCIQDHSRPLPAETVPVEHALGRTLAAPVLAAGPTPPFDCSAMDGYAVADGATGQLLIAGESRAGRPATETVSARTAVRISTGAALPSGAGAVIRQEDVRLAGNGLIELEGAVRPGANIRRAGEDLRAGAEVLAKGTLIGPMELGAAVAAGAAELALTCRPRVAVLCTGDELRAAGEPLREGEIHNSNGPMLAALAAGAGALAAAPVRLPDDRLATERGLQDALERSEVILISGGVSVGPHDHVKPALRTLGVQQRFWRVALQPGKPTWFGTWDGRLVFGLPGNPVSSAVTFALFARLALIKLLGGGPPQAPISVARLAQAVRRNPAREQALRVRLQSAPDGPLAVLNGPQGSHILSSLLGAAALALVPAGEGELPAGTEVALWPLG